MSLLKVISMMPLLYLDWQNGTLLQMEYENICDTDHYQWSKGLSLFYCRRTFAIHHSIEYVQINGEYSFKLSITQEVYCILWLNGTSIWNTTKVNLMINKGKTLTIYLDNQATGNHFQGQPIYGVVESMKDSTGNEMLIVQQKAVQRTEK